MRTPTLLRASYVAFAAMSLVSCGYTPLYAPQMEGGTVAAHLQVGTVEMATTKINVGERRVAQTVAQQLKLQYPDVAASMDTLEVTIKETTTTLAVESTAAVQRAKLTLDGSMTITDLNGKVVLRTAVSTGTAYNVESTPYSTETGKTFARLTAARNLADEISRRVVLFYRTRPAPTAAGK